MELAQRIDGEIVNCDSMQMVRGMEIGTAKPDPAMRNRVPHHLYDEVGPDEHYSAGRYMEVARSICREIAGRNRIPIVVGGTGLYLRALIDGIFQGPGRDQNLRNRISKIGERKGFEYLHRILRRKDPAAAERIGPTDPVRIIRALEVYFLTGQKISDLWKQSQSPLTGFKVVKVGVRFPRQELYDRINRRVERMFKQGLLDEVHRLLQKGFSPDCKGFEALGYRYAVSVVRDEMDLDEAIKLTQRDTRRYARRQLTWFQREQGVRWIERPGDEGAAQEALLDILRAEGFPVGSARRYFLGYRTDKWNSNR